MGVLLHVQPPAEEFLMTNPSMAHTKLHFLHLYDLRTKKIPQR